MPQKRRRQNPLDRAAEYIDSPLMTHASGTNRNSQRGSTATTGCIGVGVSLALLLFGKNQ